MNRDFSVKKKLELLQQVRSRNASDRNDMFHREKILYGKGGYDDAYYGDEQKPFSTFPLRLFLAVAVFVLLVLSDRTGSDILGLSASKCFQAISKDYESSIAAWADAASSSFMSPDSMGADAMGSDARGLDAAADDFDDRPLKDNPPTGVRP